MAHLSQELAKQFRCPHLSNAPGGQGLCVAAQCMMWRWAYDMRRIPAPKAISNLGRDAYAREVKKAVDEGFMVHQVSESATVLVRQTQGGYCGLAGRPTPDAREIEE